jgi:dTMP kinase
MFISVEGADYSGKTTQVGVMKEYYESRSRTVLVTREPGGTEVGMKIREILVQEDTINDPLSVVTQTLLLCAARVHHVDKVIIPALKRGEIVISDRFIDSTYVYQGLLYNHSDLIKGLISIDKMKYLGIRPDFTFFYDIEYETMVERMKARGASNKLDEKYAKLGERPIDSFKHHFYALNKTDPKRVKIIDGCQDIDTVKQSTVELSKLVLEEYWSLSNIYLMQVKDIKK